MVHPILAGLYQPTRRACWDPNGFSHVGKASVERISYPPPNPAYGVIGTIAPIGQAYAILAKAGSLANRSSSLQCSWSWRHKCSTHKTPSPTQQPLSSTQRISKHGMNIAELSI